MLSWAAPERLGRPPSHRSRSRAHASRRWFSRRLLGRPFRPVTWRKPWFRRPLFLSLLLPYAGETGISLRPFIGRRLPEIFRNTSPTWRELLSSGGAQMRSFRNSRKRSRIRIPFGRWRPGWLPDLLFVHCRFLHWITCFLVRRPGMDNVQSFSHIFWGLVLLSFPVPENLSFRGHALLPSDRLHWYHASAVRWGPARGHSRQAAHAARWHRTQGTNHHRRGKCLGDAVQVFELALEQECYP